MRLTTAALLSLLAAPLAADFHATWPFDGRLGVINSNVPGRTAEENLKSSGAEMELHFSPILGWDDSRWLILPAFDFEANSANTILKVEDERFVFTNQVSTGLELGTAFRRTPDQRFGFKLIASGFQGKESVDEELATGQYNYQDGGVAMDWRQKWDTQTPFRSTLGLKATNRQYPNWQTLDPVARKEKDQAITKLYTDLEWAWNSMPASTIVGVSIQTVEYAAAVVVDETGTTGAATKRRDSIFDLSLGLPMQFGAHGIEPSVRVETWTSNLAYYDSQNNYFIDRYADFGEVGGGIGYTYDFKGPWWFFQSPQVSVDLDLSQRIYAKRPAKTETGMLKPEVESDFTRNVALGFNSAYTEHWAFYTKITHLYAGSNNDDQSSALYNYEFNTFALGVNFVY